MIVFNSILYIILYILPIESELNADLWAFYVLKKYFMFILW